MLWTCENCPAFVEATNFIRDKVTKKIGNVINSIQTVGKSRQVNINQSWAGYNNKNNNNNNNNNHINAIIDWQVLGIFALIHSCYFFPSYASSLLKPYCSISFFTHSSHDFLGQPFFFFSVISTSITSRIWELMSPHMTQSSPLDVCDCMCTCQYTHH